MGDVLYAWPTAAQVDARVPKEKFYAHGAVLPSVRDKFVSQIGRIIWAYKLSPGTINLPSSADLTEIQVFRIDTRDGALAGGVLTAIDKAIPHPIIFEITRPVAGLGSGTIRMAAAYKQTGAGVKLSTHFSSDWLPAEYERQPMPTAITMSGLYAALLEPLTPMQMRPGEEMSKVADRLESIRRLDHEIAILERKLRTEPQLNRKVELRRELKTMQHVREQQR